MAAEVPKIARVYMKDPNINTHSMHHTIYAGREPLKPGTEQEMLKVEFVAGVSRNMDPQTFELLRDMGHVTTDRPKRRGDEE